MPDDVATPLSDADFVRVMHDAIVNRDGEAIEELAEDARYHRAQLAERDAEIAALRTAVEHFADNAPISLHPHRGDCAGCDAILTALKEHDDA